MNKRRTVEWNGWTLTPTKLPPMSKFASKSENVSPFEKFHKWVAKEFGGCPEGKLIDVSASWLHPEDSEKLKGQVVTWMRKCFGYTKGYAERQMGWHSLGVGPATFMNPNDKPPGNPGMVYVRADALFREPRN